MRFPRVLGWLAIAALLGACNDSDNPGTDAGDDTSPDGTVDPDASDTSSDSDVRPPDGETPPGEPCDADLECTSLLCVSIGQGIDTGFCTNRCQSAASCASIGDNWDCLSLQTDQGEFIQVCAPANLCYDRDGDGYGVGPGCLGRDCNDADPTIYPGADEFCNGIDNDCDGVPDNRPVDANQSCPTGEPGVCGIGRTACVNATLQCQQTVFPGQQQEVCDGLDNDCDGLVDELPSEDGNNNFVRGTGLPCAAAGGTCPDGLTICDPTQGIICAGGSGGSGDDSLCDGIDNNCNGQIDEDVEGLGEVCFAGQGICRVFGVTVCDTDPTAPPVCGAVANTGAQRPEQCNYQDDDCNGVVDNGFVNAQGIYNTVPNCGSCGTNCNNLWDGGPAAYNVAPTCTITAGVARCGFTCINGYVDADGVEDNGCELLPDTGAIYVSRPQRGGSDTASCGAWNSPCATITYGIQRAQSASRQRVRVSEGSYPEGIVLANGISVLGGHNSRNWLRAIETNTTAITGGNLTGQNVITVRAEGITQATELSGFTIDAPDGDLGGSSIGVFVRNSGNALTIRDNVVLAGRGGDGAPGAAGADGQGGVNGGNGVTGLNDLSSCSATNHRAGGSGGARTCGGQSVNGGNGAGGICPEYSTPGAAPTAGSGPSPGAPGFTAWGRAGFCHTNCGLSSRQRGCFPDPDRIAESFAEDGGIGGNGLDGDGGVGGSSPQGFVDPATGLWRAFVGDAGDPGGNGGGGGGGGAAHGIRECNNGSTTTGPGPCNGNRYVASTGGGGGSGGCAATAGGGGTGGGGSFAILISYSSAPANLPAITGNTLSRNQAGQGGNGGVGGRGGDGGLGGLGGDAQESGGTYAYCTARGRDGGKGGRGGHGGGGGGGAGGVSYDIYIAGAGGASSNYATVNTFVLSAGTATHGAGGPGGGSLGRPGLNGVAGQSGRILSQ